MLRARTPTAALCVSLCAVDLLDPVLSLLDRQVEALADQPTMPEFLISVQPFLRALEAEPRIAIHLEDLRDETLDRVRVIEKEDSELVPKLTELRTRLVELSPDLDDSNAAPPSEGDDRDWIDSLAQFDVIAAAEPEPLNYKAEGARSQRLLEILRAKRERLPPHTPARSKPGSSTYTTSPKSGRRPRAGSLSRCASRPGSRSYASRASRHR